MMLFPVLYFLGYRSYMLQGILGTETGLLNNLMGTRINYYSTPATGTRFFDSQHLKNTGQHDRLPAAITTWH